MKLHLLTLLCTLAAAAQQPVTTLQVSTRLVGVSALVLDKHNQPVSGLSRDAFTLLEDGKPQPITYFSQGSDLPLTLALLVDTSESQKNFIADETAASRIFFESLLKRPEDRALLVQFDTNVLRLHSMTHSADNLEQALVHLSEDHSHLRSNPRRGGTLLYDAISSVSSGSLAQEPGRRAMVLLTDGGDNGSLSTLELAVERAQRADVVIYSIFYSEGGPDAAYGEHVLKVLSETTGGRVFTVRKKTPLTAIFAEIESDMRLQYQIGYRPPDALPGSYHRIALTAGDAKEKHLKVEARTGYFTQKAAAASPPLAPSAEPLPASNPQ